MVHRLLSYCGRVWKIHVILEGDGIFNTLPQAECLWTVSLREPRLRWISRCIHNSGHLLHVIMGFTALKLLSEGFGGVIPWNHQYRGFHLNNPTDMNGYSWINFRNTLLGLHIPIFLQSGLGTGSTVEVNFDTLRVRTKPEVRWGGSGGLYMTLGVV